MPWAFGGGEPSSQLGCGAHVNVHSVGTLLGDNWEGLKKRKTKTIYINNAVLPATWALWGKRGVHCGDMDAPPWLDCQEH